MTSPGLAKTSRGYVMTSRGLVMKSRSILMTSSLLCCVDFTLFLGLSAAFTKILFDFSRYYLNITRFVTIL